MEAAVRRSPHGEEGGAVIAALLGDGKESPRAAPGLGRLSGVVEVLGSSSSPSARRMGMRIGWSVRLRLLVRCLAVVVAEEEEEAAAAAVGNGDGGRTARKKGEGCEEDREAAEAEAEAEELWRDGVLSLLGDVCDELRVSRATALRGRRRRRRVRGVAASSAAGNVGDFDERPRGRKRRRPSSPWSDDADDDHARLPLSLADGDGDLNLNLNLDAVGHDPFDEEDDWMLRNWNGSAKVAFVRDCSSIVRFFVSADDGECTDDGRYRSSGSAGGGGVGRCVSPGGGVVDGFGIELAEHLGAAISCVDEYLSVVSMPLSPSTAATAEVSHRDDRPGGVAADDDCGGASSSSSRSWTEVLLRPPGRPLSRLREVMGPRRFRPPRTTTMTALDVCRRHLPPLLARSRRGDDDDDDDDASPGTGLAGGAAGSAAPRGDDGGGCVEDVVRSVLFDRLVDDVDGNGDGDGDGDGDPTARTRREVPVSSLLRPVPTHVVLDDVLPGAVAGAMTAFYDGTVDGVALLLPLPSFFVGNVVAAVHHLCAREGRGEEVVTRGGASAVVGSALDAVYRALSAAAANEPSSVGREGWVGRHDGGGGAEAPPPPSPQRRAAMVVLQVSAGLATVAEDAARRDARTKGGGVIPSARSDAAVRWLAKRLLGEECEAGAPPRRGRGRARGAGAAAAARSRHRPMSPLPLRPCLRPFFLASARDEGRRVAAERVEDLVAGTTTDVQHRRRFWPSSSSAISFLDSLEERVDSLAAAAESGVGTEEGEDRRPPASLGGASSPLPCWRDCADGLIRQLSEVRGDCRSAAVAAPPPTDHATTYQKRHFHDPAPPPPSPYETPPPPPLRKRQRSDNGEHEGEGASAWHGGGGATTAISSEGAGDDDAVSVEASRLADAFVAPGGARRAKEWIEVISSGEGGGGIEGSNGSGDGRANGKCHAGHDRVWDEEDQRTPSNNGEKGMARAETSSSRVGARDYLSTLLSSLLLLRAEEDEHSAVAFGGGDPPPQRDDLRRTADTPPRNNASRRGMALLANHLIQRRLDGWEVGRRLLRPSPLPRPYLDEGHFFVDEAFGNERRDGPAGDDMWSFMQSNRFSSAGGKVSFLSLDVCLQNFLLRESSDGLLPDLMACTDDLFCMAISYGAHGDSDSLQSILKLVQKYSTWLVPEIAIDRYQDMFKCALKTARVNDRRGMHAETKPIAMSAKDIEYPEFDSAKLSRIFYAATKFVMILEKHQNDHGINMWGRVFSDDLCSALLPGAHLAFLPPSFNSKSRISSEREVHVLISSTVEYICCQMLSREECHEVNGIRARKIECRILGHMERLVRCWSLGWLVQAYADGPVACLSGNDASIRARFRTIYERVWGSCNFASEDKPADFSGVIVTSTKASRAHASDLDQVAKGVGGNLYSVLLPNFDTYAKYVIHLTFAFDGGSGSTSPSANGALCSDSWCRHVVHVVFRRYREGQYDRNERNLMFAWVTSLWEYLSTTTGDTGWNPILRRLHRFVSKRNVWKESQPSSGNAYCFAETIVTWLEEQGGVHDEGVLKARKFFLCELIWNTHSRGLFPCGMATPSGQVDILAERVLTISIYLENMEALVKVLIGMALHVHYCLSNEEATGIPFAMQSDWNPQARCQNLARIAKSALLKAKRKGKSSNDLVWQCFVQSVCTEIEGYCVRQGVKWWVDVAHDIVSYEGSEYTCETKRLKEPPSSNFMAKLDENLLATQRSTTSTLSTVRPNDCGFLSSDETSSTDQRNKEQKGVGAAIVDNTSHKPNRIEKYAAQRVSEERRTVHKEHIIKTLWSPNKTPAGTVNSMPANVIEKTRVEEDGPFELAGMKSIHREVALTCRSNNKETNKLVDEDSAHVSSSVDDEDDEDVDDADEDYFCEDENDNLLLLKV